MLGNIFVNARIYVLDCTLLLVLLIFWKNSKLLNLNDTLNVIQTRCRVGSMSDFLRCTFVIKLLSRERRKSYPWRFIVAYPSRKGRGCRASILGFDLITMKKREKSNRKLIHRARIISEFFKITRKN